ncbi:hypothetical protein [Streptomyces sp. NPDC055243]|uniref:hypothetical protein n=1 Tax=Streptomyces sp. NPDC055243 TaxID=3365720 RepID=UPI0037D54967
MTMLSAARCRIQRRPFNPPTTEDQFSTEAIDWIAVARVVNEDQPLPPLNEDELREAALLLRRRGMARIEVSVYLCLYERLIKEWEAEAGMLGPDQLCTIDDCRKARVGRGLCSAHLEVDRRRRRKAAARAAEMAVAA